MERRYETLLSAGVRDILSYHKEKGEPSAHALFGRHHRRTG